MPGRQVVFSAAALVVVLLWFELTHTDMWVQQYLYDATDKVWLLDHPARILSFLFYDGIKIALVLLAIGIMISLIFFRRSGVVRRYRRGLRIVLLSLIIVPSVVAGLKAETNVACPRALADFGGTVSYVRVFDPYPQGMRPAENQKCFPAGHASGGFALMSLFFLFHSPRNRWRVLYFSTALGWSMGGYKMLLGDHFLSHTVVTMVLSWMLINMIVLFDSHLSERTTALIGIKRGSAASPQTDSVS